MMKGKYKECSMTNVQYSYKIALSSVISIKIENYSLNNFSLFLHSIFLVPYSAVLSPIRTV